MRSYPHIYRLLVRYGYSVAKSAEIALDAKRGQQFARRIVGIAFCAFHRRAL